MNNKLEYKYSISFDFESYYSNRSVHFTDLDSLYKIFKEGVLTLNSRCEDIIVYIPPTHEDVAFDINIIVEEKITKIKYEDWYYKAYGKKYYVAEDYTTIRILSKEKKGNLNFVDTLEDIAEYGFDIDKVKTEIEQIYNALL